MVDKKLIGLMQEQAAREVMASQTYRSLALWCSRQSYNGCAKFLNASSADELTHRDKWLDYLNDYADELPETPAFDAMKLEPKSLLDCFEQVLALEQAVTGFINDICEACDPLNDCVTEAFLQWFLLEQIDSVKQILDFVRLLTGADGDACALLVADQRIGKAA